MLFHLQNGHYLESTKHARDRLGLATFQVYGQIVMMPKTQRAMTTIRMYYGPHRFSNAQKYAMA